MAKKKAATKKSIPKKAAPRSGTNMINVFSRAFITMMHRDEADAAQEFIVECNIDGNLTDAQGRVIKFTSLDDANDFGARHRRDNAGHKCIVKTSQRG